MIRGIDHVGIAVREGDAATTFARLLGQTAPPYADVPAQSVRVCFLPDDAPNLELLAATRDDGTLARFIERRGEGLHHVCFAVDDVAAELRRLEAEGFELIDRVPRPGHGGLVAFLHPRSTHGVLIELVERSA